MAAQRFGRNEIHGAYLTTDEVLRYLNMKARTIHRLARQGQIPAVRVGRQWRFRRTELETWLQSQPTT